MTSSGPGCCIGFGIHIRFNRAEHIGSVDAVTAVGLRSGGTCVDRFAGSRGGGDDRNALPVGIAGVGRGTGTSGNVCLYGAYSRLTTTRPTRIETTAR